MFKEFLTHMYCVYIYYAHRPTWGLRHAETRLCVFLIHVCLILRQPTNSSRAAQSTPSSATYSPQPPRSSENRIGLCRSWTAARPTAPFSLWSALIFQKKFQAPSQNSGNHWKYVDIQLIASMRAAARMDDVGNFRN